MKTLVVGHVTHDHYQGGFVAGGCAFYGAHVHSRLAGETHLSTVVGHDFACDEAMVGLDATVERGGDTTVFANYYRPDESRVQLLMASAPDISPTMPPPNWLDADLVHLAPVFGEVDLVEWGQAVGDGLLAINLQGWLLDRGPGVDAQTLEKEQARGVRGSGWRVVDRRWPYSDGELSGVDIACLSEEDIAGQPELLERLIETVPVVALTRGKQGSRIYVEAKSTDVGVYPTEVVDPTGAGDVFAAMFSHKIAQGLAPVEAAHYGAAASSIVIEDIGPRALNRLSDVNSRLPEVVLESRGQQPAVTANGAVEI